MFFADNVFEREGKWAMSEYTLDENMTPEEFTDDSMAEEGMINTGTEEQLSEDIELSEDDALPEDSVLSQEAVLSEDMALPESGNQKKKKKEKKVKKAKEKKKPEGEKGQRKSFSLNVSIKLQLLVGFLVPVFFVILVGSVSYKKAEEGMISNYETSALNTIETQVKYIDFGLSLIRGDSVQIKLDQELQSLVGGTYNNDTSKAASVYSKAVSTLKVKSTLNKFIQNLYIVPKSNVGIMGVEAGLSTIPGYYEEWAATEEGKSIINGQTTEWIGSHPEMDTFSKNDTNEYILSYVSVFPNKSAFIAADISTEAIIDNLQSIDISEGAMIGFVTADGREILVKEDENNTEITFFEQDFYQECIGGEELNGTKYVTYNGEKYLFLYCISEETGATLVYMVPEIKVTASAAQIRQITIILVIVACVVAVLIGLGISMNISISMASIIRRLKKVAGGDLTVQMKTKGRSEFSMLNRHIAEVIANTRKLIQDVEGIVDMVNDSAVNVGGVSLKLGDSFNNIIGSIGEIDKGVTQQASDSQDCLGQMDSLSNKIEEIGNSIEQTAKSSETTKEIVANSIDTMEALSGHTKETIAVTEKVKEDIKMLEKKSMAIGGFVDTINEIASETNLLSLNASIEAARAGEAGRGFAVVAEAIRKLADGSQQAANEINKVVEEIVKQTKETVSVAVNAEKIVGKQAELVNNTKANFRSIEECTEEMLAGIHHISNDISVIDSKRKETLEAIFSISAVAEETSAASGEVYNISKEQMDVVESLKRASKELEEKMVELENALAVFKTSEGAVETTVDSGK